MKKLLLPLLVLIAFSASAQLPGATKINSRYEWLGGKFNQLKIPAYCDTTQYPSWLTKVAGDIMLDTCGSDAGTIYVRYAGGYWYPVVGSGGGSGSDSLSTFLEQGYGVKLIQNVDTVQITAPAGTLSLKQAGINTEGRLDSLIAATGIFQYNTWLIDTVINISTTNKTLALTTQLIFGPTGKLNVSSGRTVTINGPFTAGRHEIFTGAGNVSLGVKSCTAVFPEWWGASAATSGDGVDDQAAFAKAFTNATNIKNMTLGSGIYQVAATVAVPIGWRITGNQWQTTSINALNAMTSVVTIGSRVALDWMRINGSFLADNGLEVLAGNRCAVSHMEVLNVQQYGVLVGVMNNSTFTDITAQYSGLANFHLNGALNCTFFTCNANSDELLVGDVNTRDILITSARNCRFIGGIYERGTNEYQIEVKAAEDVTFSQLEVNNGLSGIKVTGGTVTVDHVQFTNPIIYAVHCTGGTVNVINNSTIMTGGSNGRPMPYLYRGNIKWNGSSMFPIFSNSFRGSSGGSAISSTITRDSLKQNIGITTLATPTAGISLGLTASIYNVPPGQNMTYYADVKNIASGQPLAVHIALAAGGRRLIGYLKEGHNELILPPSQGDERYRIDVLSNVSSINSWSMSLSELWLTGADSLVNTNTVGTRYGNMEFATDTAVSTPLTVFSTSDVHKLTRAITGGGTTTATGRTRYILFTGQSNAAGYNLGDYDVTTNSKVLGWNPSTDAWVTMAPGVRPQGDGAPGTKWSTLGFANGDNSTSIAWYMAKRLQEFTGDTIKVFLLAWGGNSIDNWLPGGTGNLTTINTEMAAAGNPKIDYFGWHQGETDQFSADTTYLRKFNQMVGIFDGQSYFSQRVPIFIYSVWSGVNAMNQMQKAIGSGLYDKRYSFIDMSWLPHRGDEAHFTSQSASIAADRTVQRIYNPAKPNEYRISTDFERTQILAATPRIAVGTITQDSATKRIYEFTGTGFRAMVSDPPTSVTLTETNVNSAQPLTVQNNSTSTGLQGMKFGQMGTTGAGITGWPNTFVMEATGAGGMAQSAYSGDIKFQLGTTRGLVAKFNGSNNSFDVYFGSSFARPMKVFTNQSASTTDSMLVKNSAGEIETRPQPVGAGGATSPSGNSGAIQMNRNGAFFGTDSLKWLYGGTTNVNYLWSQLGFASSAYNGLNAGHMYSAATLGNLVSSGGWYHNQSSTSIDITLNDNDESVYVNATSATRTITLPAASSVVAGMRQRFVIIKTDASANPVVIAGTIQGVTNKSLYNQYQAVILESNGTDYQVIAEVNATTKGTTASSSTITPTIAGNTSYFDVTAQAAGLTVAAPVGVIANHAQLIVRIKDNGTSRAITWNSVFRAGTDFALPTATTISKTMYITFDYNSADSKWDAVGYTKGF